MNTQNTKNQNRPINKVVFVEYSSNKPGQHFMTIMKTVDGKRRIIGRIYKEYDTENKKMNYTAKDWAGNQVFVDAKDLMTIKKQFVEHAHTLELTIPKIGAYEKEKELKEDREMDLQELRENKASKQREHGMER